MINIISKYQKGDSQNLFTTDVYTVELHCVIVKNIDGFSSDYKSIWVMKKKEYYYEFSYLELTNPIFRFRDI